MKIEDENSTPHRKRLPTFENEDEEREFWATHSALDYFDFEEAANVVFPNLKRSPNAETESQQETQT